jgi:uncharacterized protein with HEPN domain
MPSNPVSRKIEQRVMHILDSISAIGEFIAGMSKNEYVNDRKTRSAVERQLLISSEAWTRIRVHENASGFPKEGRLENRAPDVPWFEIRALGNILRHEYDEIDAEIIWDTVSGSDLADLQAALLRAFPHLAER